MIHLKREDYLCLLRHARTCLPEEACGLLAGHSKSTEAWVEKIYCLENADHSPTHFTLSPEEQLKAILDMRKHHLELLATGTAIQKRQAVRRPKISAWRWIPQPAI